MFNLQDAFYRPLWLRIAIVAVCFGWALFELSSGATVWALLFGAIGAWAVYQFFVVWTDPGRGDDKGGADGE